MEQLDRYVRNCTIDLFKKNISNILNYLFNFIINNMLSTVGCDTCEMIQLKVQISVILRKIKRLVILNNPNVDYEIIMNNKKMKISLRNVLTCLYFYKLEIDAIKEND